MKQMQPHLDGPPANAASLMSFYQVPDLESLVAAMHSHVIRLQSKLPVNPHTAIDAWNNHDLTEPALDYKALYEQMCERCDVLDKALGEYESAAAAPVSAQVLGFEVVLDKSMPPNTMKFVQPVQEPVAWWPSPEDQPLDNGPECEDGPDEDGFSGPRPWNSYEQPAPAAQPAQKGPVAWVTVEDGKCISTRSADFRHIADGQYQLYVGPLAFEVPAAIKTLEALGYVYEEGEQWTPPPAAPVISAGPITPEMANWSESDKADLAVVMARHLTTPPAAPVPLTDEVIERALKAACMHSTPESRKDMRCAIEAAAQPAPMPSVENKENT
jgi:hypothetical protein